MKQRSDSDESFKCSVTADLHNSPGKLGGEYRTLRKAVIKLFKDRYATLAIRLIITSSDTLNDLGTVENLVHAMK